MACFVARPFLVLSKASIKNEPNYFRNKHSHSFSHVNGSNINKKNFCKFKYFASLDNSATGSSEFEKKKTSEDLRKKFLGNENSKEIESEIEKMLSDEESQILMKDLSAAVERVKKARAALDEISKHEKMALVSRFEIEAKASLDAEQVIADSLVSSMETEVLEAEKAMQEAEKALVIARASVAKDGIVPGSKDADRLESVKAAVVSATAGTFSSIPLVYLNSNGDILNTIVNESFILSTCALFGITYRYIIRDDHQNVHLKSGAVGAFGLTRGLALMESSQPFSGLESFFQSLLGVGESLLIVALSAAALDFCIREQLLLPYSGFKNTE